MLLCWSAKGGSGTTVVATALALGLSSTAPTTLVDLSGDLAAVLAAPAGPGVFDWMGSSVSTASSLAALRSEIVEGVGLIPAGERPVAIDDAAWRRLAAALDEHTVIDAGIGPPPVALAQRATASLLVIRPCYLALRKAIDMAGDTPPTGVIVIDDVNGTYRAAEIARVVGAPLVARVSIDPAIPRCIASGTARHRFPAQIVRELRGVW